MRTTITFICSGVVLASVLLMAIPDEQKGIEGIWLGTLDTGTLKLRLVFNIFHGEDGSLKATMDSIDQGVKDIAVDGVAFKEGKLELKIEKLMVTYEAALSEDEKEREDGQIVYEVEILSDGKEYEVEVTPDGNILEIEEDD